MSLATIVLMAAGLMAGSTPLASPFMLVQTAPAPQSAQANSTPAPAATAKPCPAVPASGSAAASDCKPTANRKKRKPRPPAAGATTGPTRKVVSDGSTTDPGVEISVGSPQQVSQQLGTTNDLLAMTEENLKIVERRQLTVGQQDTVKQIKIYMEQSRAAAQEKDAERAYTLADKARMLSGDLVKH